MRVGKTIWCALLLVAAGPWQMAEAAPRAANVCDASLIGRIPARPAHAATATEFVRDIADSSPDARETAIRDQLLAGNVPQFLRHLVPVTMGDGAGANVVLCVLPDYLSIGSDPDYVLVPMRLATALSVANQYGFIIPTPKMVDAIDAQSQVRLTPQPLPASPAMVSTAYYAQHNELIRAQRAALGVEPGELTTGEKKDLVITNRLWDKLSSVAIYGWRRLDGSPIQPLSTVHGKRYADYSHGVRLISAVAYLNGAPARIVDLLQNPRYAAVLSSEGVMRGVSELLHTLAVN